MIFQVVGGHLVHQESRVCMLCWLGWRWLSAQELQIYVGHLGSIITSRDGYQISFFFRSDVAVRSGQLFKFIIINPTISHIRITARVLDRIWQTQCHKASIRDDLDTNPFLIPVPKKHWGCSTLNGWQGLPLWRCHLHLWMYLVYHHPRADVYHNCISLILGYGGQIFHIYTIFIPQ